MADADADEQADDGQLYEHFRIEVDKGQDAVRIDKFLSEHQPHSSRNRIQKAADAGFIHVCTAEDKTGTQCPACEEQL